LWCRDLKTNLNIRIPNSWHDLLDDMAEENDISKSEAARQFMKLGMDHMMGNQRLLMEKVDKEIETLETKLDELKELKTDL